jgi:hypothetical protein
MNNTGQQNEEVPKFIKETTWNTFPNIGYIKTKFTKEELKPVLEEIEKISLNFENTKKVGKYLSGNIDQQYELVDSFKHIEKITKELSVIFLKFFGVHNPENINNISLMRTWVNFQKKHEFNPLHVHIGDLSFVIFVKIPFKTEDETKIHSETREVDNVPGVFTFVYTNTLGRICSDHHHIDEKDELTIYLFDAKTSHAVWPFYTSDDYRITVSGNLKINLDESSKDKFLRINHA